MGSCYSVHKDDVSAESANKKPPTATLLADLLLKPHPSPHHHAAVTTSSDDFGSNESFFDTQPWLESDCEDDFYSVKGDFTPSCGSTPANQSFSLGTPKINGAILTDRAFVPQPELLSPKKKSKKLFQLFRESLGGDRDFAVLDNAAHNQTSLSIKKAAIMLQTTGFDVPQKSAAGTPYSSSSSSSACSSQRTPGLEVKADDSKSTKSGQCCLPRLL
ncbi:uncharacterized protein LOC115998358 [Ipomoea triloba]|uniref:uncharacterized protein LOC115998358 n=1 Tax=Ipomoea triloba TaxID=35885 RepID=UPI00125DC367|nr:uncharacterized protein LOC115998358 [Ipomoea triloba]